MTYQHALRYLTEAQGTDEPTLPARELRALLESPTTAMTAPMFIRISHDKQASVASRFLRTVLCEAGIGCLHVIETNDCEPRDRFLLNGAPIPPTLLCAHAQDVHTREILLRRQPDVTGRAFPVVERTATLLVRIAAEQNVRVLLVESNEAPLCEALIALAAPSSLTVVSATDVGGQTALASIGKTTGEVITHASGAAVIRSLSDACAKIGSRLTVIPRAAIRRREVTPASQTIDTAVLSDCRLPAATVLATDAAALALQVVASLRRHGFAISDEQIRRGLGRTVLPAELTPVSIRPLLIVDCVDNAAELAITMRELTAMSLPRKVRLWLDSALSLPRESAALFDEVRSGEETVFADEEGTTLLIGSRAFLSQALKKCGKSQKNL